MAAGGRTGPSLRQRASLAPRGYLQEDLVFVLEVNETYKPWLIERDRQPGREAGNAHRIAVHVEVLDDYRPSRTILKSTQLDCQFENSGCWRMDIGCKGKLRLSTLGLEIFRLLPDFREIIAVSPQQFTRLIGRQIGGFGQMLNLQFPSPGEATNLLGRR